MALRLDIKKVAWRGMARRGVAWRVMAWRGVEGKYRYVNVCHNIKY